MDQDNKYVIMMETTDTLQESIYYFLKYNGNEEIIGCLSSQISNIIWYNFDGMSTFDLDTTNIVSESTAVEMCKVCLNSSPHRKFDGRLKHIDFEFLEEDTDEIKIEKVFDLIGLGKIENYIDQEDTEFDYSTSDDDSDSGEEGESSLESD